MKGPGRTSGGWAPALLGAAVALSSPAWAGRGEVFLDVGAITKADTAVAELVLEDIRKWRRMCVAWDRTECSQWVPVTSRFRVRLPAAEGKHYLRIWLETTGGFQDPRYIETNVVVARPVGMPAAPVAAAPVPAPAAPAAPPATPSQPSVVRVTPPAPAVRQPAPAPPPRAPEPAPVAKAPEPAPRTPEPAPAPVAKAPEPASPPPAKAPAPAARVEVAAPVAPARVEEVAPARAAVAAPAPPKPPVVASLDLAKPGVVMDPVLDLRLQATSEVGLARMCVHASAREVACPEGAWKPFAERATVTWDGPGGTVPVHAVVEDVLGQRSAPRSVEVSLDLEAPKASSQVAGWQDGVLYVRVRDLKDDRDPRPQLQLVAGGSCAGTAVVTSTDAVASVARDVVGADEVAICLVDDLGRTRELLVVEVPPPPPPPEPVAAPVVQPRIAPVAVAEAAPVVRGHEGPPVVRGARVGEGGPAMDRNFSLNVDALAETKLARLCVRAGEDPTCTPESWRAWSTSVPIQWPGAGGSTPVHVTVEDVEGRLSAPFAFELEVDLEPPAVMGHEETWTDTSLLVKLQTPYDDLSFSPLLRIVAGDEAEPSCTAEDAAFEMRTGKAEVPRDELRGRNVSICLLDDVGRVTLVAVVPKP